MILSLPLVLWISALLVFAANKDGSFNGSTLGSARSFELDDSVPQEFDESIKMPIAEAPLEIPLAEEPASPKTIPASEAPLSEPASRVPAENSQESAAPRRSPLRDTRHGPLRRPASTGPSPSEDAVIIQFLPELSVDRFLTVYPTLKLKMQGNVSIGAFKAVYGNFDRRFIRFLAYSNLVLEISRDVNVKITNVQAEAPRHLARLSRNEKLREEGPYDYLYDPSAGHGVDVFIFDTGIYRSHPSFENRVEFGIDLTGEGPGDINGHGTFIAGVVGSKTHGVAKRATLVDVKVIGANGIGKLSHILQGIDYVIHRHQQTNRPSVINMSFTAMRNNVFNRAIQALLAMDIPVVTGAGNQDTSACRMSPGSVPGVLVVGAFDDRTETVASFSNWGQCVDVFAPGVNVDSLDNRGAGFVQFSGTSVSAAIGSGLVAYFLGMGDQGWGAIHSVLALRLHGQLTPQSFLFRPSTANLILYNDAGEPLW